MEAERYAKALEFAGRHRTDHGKFSEPAVELGAALHGSEISELEEHLHALGPWRKGPFRILGRELHGHWKSDRKWKRVLEYLDDVGDKTIADIGCNNGYYMFRCLDLKPARVIGFDPAVNFERQFRFLHRLYPDERLEFRREGYEALSDFPGEFDVVLCMGIVYHHTDPVGILRGIHRALKTGGRIVLESMGIPGEDSHCLVPAGKYAGGRGVWFVPTVACLENWLRRAAFRDIQVRHVYSDIEEQERSEFAELPSLKEFLDPNDLDHTVEGYPAPIRIHISARR